ncbi:MAG: outer membrane beta-barrel family protein [Bacteroidota bacterium]
MRGRVVVGAWMLGTLWLINTASAITPPETAPPHNVSGSVTDADTKEVLSFATVAFLSPMDSAIVQGGVTDLEGNFQMNVPEGSYLLQVQFLTYETFTQAVAIEKGARLKLGEITLSPAQLNLEEVVVEAERTQVQLTLDKRIYSVGKDLSNLGGSAADILDNLPSVTVDVEGNVQLRGSSNLQILIDGKPSGLVGLSSQDALRQLQGNLIDRVEVITNPSARYDAAGMAGIINIVLKKGKKKGINGSFQANTGVPHNHGASANVNFRRDWVNLFVNYGLDYRASPGGGNAFQNFTFPDTSYFTNVGRDRIRTGLSNNVRFGADFYLSDRQTLTTSFLYRYSDEENESDLVFEDFDGNRELLNYTLREDLETESDENLEYSVNYTYKFKREGHKFTADVQYQNNNEREQSEILQSEGPSEAELIPALRQRVDNQEGEQRWMLQADYIQPFAKKAKFEAGWRSTLRDIKNIYRVDEENEEGIYVPLDTFSTDFAYDENVHAAYAIISNEHDKLSWQAGVRSETTDINTEFRETGETFSWNYTNLFPSAFLTYKLTKINQLQASYSRRINRPRFRELNPFSSFTDNRNFRVGNPNLQPEFTDSYELGMIQSFKKSSFYYGVYYRQTNQLIQRITLPPDERGLQIRIPENIGSEESIGIEVNGSHDFTDWYRVNGNFNFFRSEIAGMVGDSISLAATAVTVTSRLSNNFKFENLFDAQVNINYRGPQNTTQGRQLAITVVDIGLSRDVLQKNGTLSLAVRDLFNQRKWRSITELDNFYEESEFQWRRGPTVMMTFTYRLNQKKQRQRGGGRDRGFGGDGF